MPRKHGEYLSAKEAFTETAKKLFTEKGLFECSLSDIAGLANLSKGTLFYYYQAKDQLIADISEERFSRITDTIYEWIETLGEFKCCEDALGALIGPLGVYFDKLYFVLCSEGIFLDWLSALVTKKHEEWRVLLEVASIKAPPAQNGGRADISKLILLLDSNSFQEAVGAKTLDAAEIIRLIAKA